MVQKPNIGFEGLRGTLQAAGFELNRAPWEGPPPAAMNAAAAQNPQKQIDRANDIIEGAKIEIARMLANPMLTETQKSYFREREGELIDLQGQVNGGGVKNMAALVQQVTLTAAHVQAVANQAESGAVFSSALKMTMTQGMFNAEQRAAVSNYLYATSEEFRVAADQVYAEIAAEAPATAKRQERINEVSEKFGVDTTPYSERIEQIRGDKAKAKADNNVLELARLEAEEQAVLAEQAKKAAKAAAERGTPEEKTAAEALAHEQEAKKAEAIKRYEKIQDDAIKAARQQGDTNLVAKLEKDKETTTQYLSGENITVKGVEQRVALAEQRAKAAAAGAAPDVEMEPGPAAAAGITLNGNKARDEPGKVGDKASAFAGVTLPPDIPTNVTEPVQADQAEPVAPSGSTQVADASGASKNAGGRAPLN